MIQAQMTVNEVVHAFPQTMPVFAEYRIDLCCGGVKTLEEVSRRHGFDLAVLLEKLNHAVAGSAHAR